MKKRSVYIWAMRLLMWLAAGITAALTLFLLGYVLIKGLPIIRQKSIWKALLGRERPLQFNFDFDRIRLGAVLHFT